MNTHVGSRTVYLTSRDWRDHGDFVGWGQDSVDWQEIVATGEAGDVAQGSEFGVTLHQKIPKR